MDRRANRMLCCAFGFQSCKEDNYSYYVLPYPNALVTVKPQQDNSFYLQLDDSTTLLPTNLATSPFGEKEVRALVNYVETDEAHGNYSKAVHINWIDRYPDQTNRSPAGFRQRCRLWNRPGRNSQRLGYFGRRRLFNPPFPHSEKRHGKGTLCQSAPRSGN